MITRMEKVEKKEVKMNDGDAIIFKFNAILLQTQAMASLCALGKLSFSKISLFGRLRCKNQFKSSAYTLQGTIFFCHGNYWEVLVWLSTEKNVTGS